MTLRRALWAALISTILLVGCAQGSSGGGEQASNAGDFPEASPTTAAAPPTASDRVLSPERPAPGDPTSQGKGQTPSKPRSGSIHTGVLIGGGAGGDPSRVVSVQSEKVGDVRIDIAKRNEIDERFIRLLVTNESDDALASLMVTLNVETKCWGYRGSSDYSCEDHSDPPHLLPDPYPWVSVGGSRCSREIIAATTSTSTCQIGELAPHDSLELHIDSDPPEAWLTLNLDVELSYP